MNQVDAKKLGMMAKHHYFLTPKRQILPKDNSFVEERETTQLVKFSRGSAEPEQARLEGR